MELFAWLTPIHTAKEFSALMSLVEEGTLEELFIAKTAQAGVAGEAWEAELPLVFSFSEHDCKDKLNFIAPTRLLDEIDEIYFEEIEGEFTLKGVFYPESQAQEDAIIKQLS